MKLTFALCSLLLTTVFFGQNRLYLQPHFESETFDRNEYYSYWNSQLNDTKYTSYGFTLGMSHQLNKILGIEYGAGYQKTYTNVIEYSGGYWAGGGPEDYRISGWQESFYYNTRLIIGFGGKKIKPKMIIGLSSHYAFMGKYERYSHTHDQTSYLYSSDTHNNKIEFGFLAETEIRANHIVAVGCITAFRKTFDDPYYSYNNPFKPVAFNGFLRYSFDYGATKASKRDSSKRKTSFSLMYYNNNNALAIHLERALFQNRLLSLRAGLNFHNDSEGRKYGSSLIALAGTTEHSGEASIDYIRSTKPSYWYNNQPSNDVAFKIGYRASIDWFLLRFGYTKIINPDNKGGFYAGAGINF